MKIVSFNELIELNRNFEEKSVGLKVHLRDACGGQSFWIEKLTTDCDVDLFYSELENYFKNKNLSVEYFEDKMSFRII
ncbi:MAG: hypothetical protein K0R15_1984 [Clostridiales bacterium]|jgi:hypothetical protein|nr:hypothetical protein [Clostridiales bacterium]